MEPSKERTYELKDCYRVFIISKNLIIFRTAMAQVDFWQARLPHHQCATTAAAFYSVESKSHTSRGGSDSLQCCGTFSC